MYEINLATIAILAIDENRSKVIEDDETFIVERPTPKVIDDSCRYFGSSYIGRFEGSKNFLGRTIYKSPIIIEETNEIIFFPTGSARSSDCSWICLKKIERFEKKDNQTLVYFKNGSSITVPIRYASFQNQVLRASRLESVLRQRKAKKA
ncbi:MAG: hypothetical protein GX190_01550 [Mollicutes bacterium]|nr:hypothetical protein [Mollicutes bacterium]